jgi:hypothetical protein
MERLAIYVNDARSAGPVLETLLSRSESGACTVVLCPPRLSHRVGKWVSTQQRQEWQRHCADRVRQDLTALLPPELVGKLDWLAASGRLGDTASELRRSRGTAIRLLDLRKARLGESLPALEAGLPSPANDRWTTPVAVTSSLTVMLALMD